MKSYILTILVLVPASSALAEAVCARSSFVSLYEEPKIKSRVTWRAAKYMPFLNEQKKGEWLRLIDLDGVTHWGRARDFRKDIRCVVVKSTVAKLRTAPKADSDLAYIKSLDRYTPLKRLGEDEGWIQVEDEAGNRAWINETNVWKPAAVTAIAF